MPAFVGLDLAWTTRNESGICFLFGDDPSNLRCTRLEAAVVSTEDLADQVAAALPAVVAIDAPVRYSEERWAEREIARRFGRYKASAHSAHHAVKQGYTAGIDLGKALAPRGFQLDPTALLNGDRDVRFALEIYPHTIHIRLFSLAERLPYKRGPVATRRQVMQTYQLHLRDLIRRNCPGVLGHRDVERALAPDTAQQARGSALKRLDDTLDGLTCAVAAWLIWSQPSNWEMIGDEHGYIVAPRETLPDASQSG